MKFLSMLVTLALAASSAWAADTTLEFDLTGDTVTEINIDKLNAQLKDKGLEGLPHRVVVTAKGERAYWRVLSQRIDAAREAGLLGEYDNFVIENGYLHEYPEICYRGNIEDVPEILEAMHTVTDKEQKDGGGYRSFLHVDSGLLGVAWSDQKKALAEFMESSEKVDQHYGVDEDGGGEVPDAVNEFFRWKTKTYALVVTDLGPQGDGTEAYATVIKPCKKD
ncbi:MAG TPA: hypothetical protein VM901_07185 [Bdellovibrionota bacterium]|jgi:hypothetical protein|nr:hypothetical protein [Bdellovibrionota bacterium]